MKKILLLLSILLACACTEQNESTITSHLRAPAYPLITIDTYTNAWLFGDTLYNEQLSHWTGKEFPLLGALRVDGKVFRFMGIERNFFVPLIETNEGGSWEGKYVNEMPQGDWKSRYFDDANWSKGEAAFGKHNNDINIKTPWDSESIWVRREFTLKDSLPNEKIYLEFSHDDDVEIYINGIEVTRVIGVCQENTLVELSDEVISSLQQGEKNIIAAYCRNTGGDAYLDFRLAMELSVEACFENTAIQNSVEVLPTQTLYHFTCGPVDLELTFTAPLLMDDLDLLSQPVNYITYKISSNDTKYHTVDFYLEAGTTWALNTFSQRSESETFEKDNLLYLKTGSKEQHILGKKGDDIRIDWGYFYLCSENKNTRAAVGNCFSMREEFLNNGSFSNDRPASPDGQDQLAFIRKIGKIKKPQSGYFMLGYDDIYSMQYFGENLLPYWNRNGDKNIYDVFSSAERYYKKRKKACDKFDISLMEESIKCGGQEYAELCALAYRQSVSAHKLLQAPNGDLLFLSKENYSSGAIATVDVTYPSAPLFLLYNVELMKGMLNPIFYYVESGKWDKPFAPHDIGLYPIANGQTTALYLPVEESGNMLILSTAIAVMEGNAAYAQEHWETISGWADFLAKKGFDPEYQENTDIFTGFSAHNANLSIKAILGIASYGKLADMLGYNDIARKYTELARQMALQWVKETDDNDHYRFAFDQPGTWSQKYNLVWDKILKINVFPHEVPEKEVAYYLSKQNKYGLPIDSRHQYTKADWIVWSASLAMSKSDFEKFINPLYRFVNETTDRIPMSDWYWTDKPEHVSFRARSVLGGYFIKMMENKIIYQSE